MDITSESFNYLALLVPTLAAFATCMLPAVTPRRRILSVVVPAACVILVIGFGLQGLTRACFDEKPICQPDERLVPVHGNTFGVQVMCAQCLAGTDEDSAYLLNQYRPAVLLAAMLLCCSASSWTLLSFMKWAKQTRNS